MEEEKECRRCNQTKLVSMFPVEKRNRDGLASWCIDCTREYSRTWQRNKYQSDLANMMKNRATPEQIKKLAENIDDYVSG